MIRRGPKVVIRLCWSVFAVAITLFSVSIGLRYAHRCMVGLYDCSTVRQTQHHCVSSDTDGHDMAYQRARMFTIDGHHKDIVPRGELRA